MGDDALEDDLAKVTLSMDFTGVSANVVKDKVDPYAPKK